MFDQLREAAFSVADSVTSVFSPKGEGAIKKISFDEESAQNIQVTEPSLFWASVMSAPIWEQKIEAARKQLLLESKKMRACHGCNVNGVEVELLHGRFCSENFHKVGMGITLLHAVKSSNYELVKLVRDLSLSTSASHQGYLSPDYLIRAALLAVEHGSYEIVLSFGFEWLTGIMDVDHLSESYEKVYLLYVQKVLERVFAYSYTSSDDELKNLSNIDELLSSLLPTRAKSREVFNKLQPAIDSYLQRNLLHIVGCGEGTHRVRQLLINEYGILFHPRNRPPDSNQVMTGLAEKILREGKGIFEVRQRLWLRSAMNELPIKRFVLGLLVMMKQEIMLERRPFGEKLILRRQLSEATSTIVILPKRSEEIWGGLLRWKKGLGCCPRREERFDPDGDNSAMESLLPGMGESGF